MHRIMLAIVLPSGLECGAFTLKLFMVVILLSWQINGQHHCLILKNRIKKAKLYCIFLSNISSRIGWVFQEKLKKYRSRSTECIKAVARICLPFLVETQIHNEHSFARRDSSKKLVYVRFEASVKKYPVDTDKGGFDLQWLASFNFQYWM